MRAAVRAAPRYGWLVILLIILFLAVGVLPLAVAVAALLRRRWSTPGHAAFGAALLGWIVIEWLMLGYLSFLQPFVVGYGILVLALALINLRRQASGAAVRG